MRNSIKIASSTNVFLTQQTAKPKAKYAIFMYADLCYEENVKDELYIAHLGDSSRKRIY